MGRALIKEEWELAEEMARHEPELAQTLREIARLEQRLRRPVLGWRRAWPVSIIFWVAASVASWGA